MGRRQRRRRRAAALGLTENPAETYHTAFGLPPNLARDPDPPIGDYDDTQGGVIRHQRELFILRLAAILRNIRNEPAGEQKCYYKGAWALSAPGLGKTDIARRVGAVFGVRVLFTKPTWASLARLLWDWREVPVLICVDDAMRAVGDSTFMNKLLDLTETGSASVVRVDTAEAAKNKARREAGQSYDPDQPDPQFCAPYARFLLLLNPMTNESGKASQYINGFRSRMGGDPIEWSSDPIDRLAFVLWFAHQGAVMRAWRPGIAVEVQNEIICRFIETVPYRRDLSLRGLLALCLLRVQHPNNWIAMDAEHATSATPVYTEAGKGGAPLNVPNWIWERRGAYITPRPNRGGADGATPDEKAPSTAIVAVPEPPLQWKSDTPPYTTMIVRHRGHEKRVGMSQQAYDELCRTVRGDWEKRIDAALNICKAKAMITANEFEHVRTLAVGLHLGWLDVGELYGAGIGRLSLDPAPPRAPEAVNPKARWDERLFSARDIFGIDPTPRKRLSRHIAKQSTVDKRDEDLPERDDEGNPLRAPMSEHSERPFEDGKRLDIGAAAKLLEQLKSRPKPAAEKRTAAPTAADRRTEAPAPAEEAADEVPSDGDDQSEIERRITARRLEGEPLGRVTDDEAVKGERHGDAAGNGTEIAVASNATEA